LIFAFLIFILGVRHPPPLNDLTPLDARRWVVGAVAVVVLVGGFVIIPIDNPTGRFALVEHTSQATGHAAPGGMADNLTLTLQDQDLVPYGYTLSGKVTAVVASVNGSTPPLGPAAYDAFVANSTWTVYAPNGNVSTFPGTGAFSLASSQYTTLQPGQNATFRVLYTNPAQATVIVQLTARPLCAPSMDSQSATYQLS